MLIPIAAALLAAGDVLSVGDPAPPIDIEHWLKGEAIDGFEPGRIYVLEFWATWCRPCVAGMEHLSTVQEMYADDGVTVIGVSDEPLQKVVRFLCSRTRAGVLQHDRVRYGLATDPDRSVFDAYMVAAWQGGLPTAFVVGRDGVIEWIGNPKSLEEVLDPLVSGRWDRAAAASATPVPDVDFRRQNAKLAMAREAGDWAAALEAVDAIIATGREVYVPTRLRILLSDARDHERGYAYARQIVRDAWNGDGWLLMQVAWLIWGYPDAPIDDEHRDMDLALKAMTRANELTGWSDWDYLSMQAGMESSMGRHDDAASHMR
ncbi:MAG: peroxiredoxin family protein, partial [Planctomycetota bacterium]